MTLKYNEMLVQDILPNLSLEDIQALANEGISVLGEDGKVNETFINYLVSEYKLPELTPEQKIMWLILDIYNKDEYTSADETISFLPTAESLEESYEKLQELDAYWDIKYEIRSGHVETSIPSPSSRYHESKSVAVLCPDNTWVGWTYWYGGGKHAEPEAIDWMETAYHLDVVEEEKLITVRTFTKVEEK